MSSQVKMRRGTTAEHSTFIGAEGEVTVDTTKSALVVHDGLRAGGHSVPKASELGTAATESAVNLKSGRKNLIINGDMQVSERGDYASATTVVADTYYIDRWVATQGAITSTIQNASVTVDGMSSKAIRFAATSSATQFMGVRQFVEFVNIPVGKMLTVSAFVRTNSSHARFRTNSFGGAGNQSPTFPNDGQWSKVSWTFDSTDTTTDSDIFFCMYGDAGLASITSGDYIEFTQVQLEVGSVATDFEHRSYGEELALCQRYGLRLKGGRFAIGNWNSITNISAFVFYPVPLRTQSPTLIVNTLGSALRSAISWHGISSIAISADTTETLLVLSADTASSGASYGHPTNIGSSADYFIDAEL